MNHRRPRLAQPFTVLTAPDTVRLIAGEDFRYTLTGAGLDQWLPDFLARCTGKETLDAILGMLAEALRPTARQLVERLFGERVMVDGPTASAHVPRAYGCAVQGDGTLGDRLRQTLTPDAGSPRITILCQDSLDFGAVLECQRQAFSAHDALLWVSYGALTRAYVSPLLLPDAGPCFACLLRCFQRLSPAPEIYDALLDHQRQGKRFAVGEFPSEGIAILQALVQWKLKQAELEQPSSALYRLHVLERATFEISTHQVFVDPECPECRGGRR